MTNLPPETFRQIQEIICRPEGTFSFRYHCPELLDKTLRGGIILEIPSGEHLFRLERGDDYILRFYHSSPGTGTRAASIDLEGMPASPLVFMAFSWTPKEIALYIGLGVPGGELRSATGVASKKQLRVGKDGKVYQIGDEGMEIMGVNVYQGETPILQPTALEAWKEALQAMDILATGQSTKGFLYEVVVANLTLAVLVTGFEAYTKKRFLELEEEGIRPEVEKLIERFYPRREREAGIAEILEQEAKDAKSSLLQHIVGRRTINFQSYDECKRAYNKTYGIKFGGLGVSSQKIEALQSFILYRHKIIHVSACLAFLNQERVPPEEPVFSKRETAKKARECFEEFVEKLHQATLCLRR